MKKIIKFRGSFLKMPTLVAECHLNYWNPNYLAKRVAELLRFRASLEFQNISFKFYQGQGRIFLESFSCPTFGQNSPKWWVLGEKTGKTCLEILKEGEKK